MADQKFISAANLFGWGQSFNATGKFPLIAKRVWETYNDMLAFVSDTSDVCPAGVVLTVINDTDPKKNGAYFVASCPTLENPDLPVDVQKIGSGEKLVATTYADALLLAIEDNIGAVVYVSTETDAGKSGLYVITDVGNVERLGTTTATGDLSGDVATLKTDVGTLKTDIAELEEALGKIDYPVDDIKVNDVSVVVDGVANIDLTPYAKLDDVSTELDKKVDKEGYIAYSQSEKDKLAGIEAGANNVQKIVVKQGDASEEVVYDATSHSFTIQLPEDKVLGIVENKENAQILSIGENGLLDTTLSIRYVHDSENETPYQIQLVGKNGVVSSIDAKDFVKDGMLSGAELVKNPEGKDEGTYLVLQFNTESGLADPIYVSVSDLIDTYVGSDSINVDGKVISAKVKSGDSYIEVTSEGIASKGIDNAITVAKNEIKGYVDSTVVPSLTATISTKVDAVEGKGLSTNDFTNDLKLKLGSSKVLDVDTTESNGIALNLSESKVGVNVDASKLSVSLVGETGSVGSISGTTVKLGQAITDGAEENPTEIISATTSVQSAIQTLAGQIQAAVAGGITAIDGGEYITVGGTATSKTLTLDTKKVAEAIVSSDSAIKIDSNGKLYLEWTEI